MISFQPFWDKMKERGISIYSLEYDYEFNPAMFNRLKNGHNFTLRSIEKICETFNLKIEDVVEFKSQNE